MFGMFDPLFWVLIGPAFLLGIIAQIWVKSAFSSGERHATPISGCEAARRILDSAGLRDINIEVIPGALTDHYDPGARVLRLSEAVYYGHTASSVGVAAHEAGHALQHAHSYLPLVLRNLAVPLAGFGSGAGVWMLFIGLILSLEWLIWAGIILFAGVVVFQVINLPVEFNASTRARAQLAEMGIFSSEALSSVSRVLTAAAMTYVAATLQAIMTLLYYILRANSRQD